MALPKIDVPIYEAILPSNNQVVKFRPFLVKEQKLLLMAAQSSEIEEVVGSIKQALKNCMISELEIDTLPVFDLEFLFLNLRARSVGEVVNVTYKCNNVLSIDPEGNQNICPGSQKFDINVLEIKPKFGEEHTDKIMITDNLGIVMKYPSFEIMQKFQGKNEEEVLFELIIKCIDYIFDKDNIYYVKDLEKEEISEFIDSMQQQHLEKIKSFFDTMPKITKELDFHCSKCGFEETINLEGVQSFFG
jgi:hypothetical protein